ncbi:MAG: NAD(P)/FAD-dependent oxidoreductase, partial [Planctomycetota bacterium]
QKFGATLALPMDVQSIEGTRPPYQLKLAEHTPISCRSIVIASGATYRTLDLENYEKFEGRGIHYAATAIEAGLCHGEEVIVVGGGNSAGQAAVYLAGRAKHVHMLVRGEGLAASMSEYLIRRIDASDSITLHCQTAIVRLDGDDSLQHVTWRNRETGEESTHPICHVFTMIGAVPNTKWLGDCVLQDEKGFVCTGQPVADSDEWPLERAPEPFETTLPGVFAIGDVRATSVKRVASAVGEGSICVQFVHRTLAAEKA